MTYPKAQGIIQASWNWPYSRKDIEVYGKKGYVFADRVGMRYQTDPQKGETKEQIEALPRPYNDPFLFLEAVVRGKITPAEDDLSGLPVNMIAMEILDAAKRSARTGRTILLKNP